MDIDYVKKDIKVVYFSLLLMFISVVVYVLSYVYALRNATAQEGLNTAFIVLIGAVIQNISTNMTSKTKEKYEKTVSVLDNELEKGETSKCFYCSKELKRKVRAGEYGFCNDDKCISFAKSLLPK